MTIREKITAWEPAAEWSAEGDGMLTVPVETFHDLAVRLKREGFDFLARTSYCVSLRPRPTNAACHRWETYGKALC